MVEREGWVDRVRSSKVGYKRRFYFGEIKKNIRKGG